MLCGRCLKEDEGEFKEDSVICSRCDPKLKGYEALPRSTVGMKSPRHRHPSYRGPPIVEEQATQPAAQSKKQRKTKTPPTLTIPQQQLFLPMISTMTIPQQQQMPLTISQQQLMPPTIPQNQMPPMLMIPHQHQNQMPLTLMMPQ